MTHLSESPTIAFIGTAGIPNRYGGFESFLEHCAPSIASRNISVTVTCDRRLYPDQAVEFKGVRREFVSIPANGILSIIHDALAFLKTFRQSNVIVVLGVSGALWFPLFRLCCDLAGKRLIVNIDGVEWRRTKFSLAKRYVLKKFDYLAQRFSHHVIYDNSGLYQYLLPFSRTKCTCIAYSGDHVLRVRSVIQTAGTALTVCRIEPENNIELLIEGALSSSLREYTIVGNWSHSTYSRSLRERFCTQSRLRLVDPLYDPFELALLRERCQFYLHGHSVGGTNPSLVEMLFYDCAILCFDVEFNRFTAGDCATYFSTADDLRRLLNGFTPLNVSRDELRTQYTSEAIASAYINAAISA